MREYDYALTGATIRINLVRATFIGVPLETPIHYRPYQCILDGATVNEIHDLTHGGINIGASTFSTISGRVLAPTSQSKGVIQLPHGWGQRRYSVNLEFMVDHGGMSHIESLQGYTTHDGISRAGALDPAMGVYINSQTSGKVMNAMVNGVNRQHYGSSGSMQVLTPVTYVDQGYSGGQYPSQAVANVAMRPTDVMKKAQVASLNIQSDIDHTSKIYSGVGETSTRDNALGNRYLSRVFSGYMQSRGANPGMEDMIGGVWGEAASAVNEIHIEQLLLFRRLQDSTQVNQTNYVTIAELARMWPQIMDPQFTVVHMLNVGGLIDHTQMYEGWGSAVQETALAHVLCQSVPALMGGLLLSAYSFGMTNRTLTGATEITTTGAAFLFDVLDGPKRVAVLEQHIKTEIAGYIASNGVSDFSITMQCVVMGSNTLKISINGGMERSYSAPAYCDSLYAPVIGSGMDQLDRMSSTLAYALENVYDTDSNNAKFTWEN